MTTGYSNKKDAQRFADERERHRKGVMAAGSDRAMRAKMLLAEGVAEIERETFTANRVSGACLTRLLRRWLGGKWLPGLPPEAGLLLTG